MQSAGNSFEDLHKSANPLEGKGRSVGRGLSWHPSWEADSGLNQPALITSSPELAMPELACKICGGQKKEFVKNLSKTKTPS